jgi:hypothetical protein
MACTLRSRRRARWCVNRLLTVKGWSFARQFAATREGAQERINIRAHCGQRWAETEGGICLVSKREIPSPGFDFVLRVGDRPELVHVQSAYRRGKLTQAQAQITEEERLFREIGMPRWLEPSSIGPESPG